MDENVNPEEKKVKKQNSAAKKIAILALLTGMSLITFILEGLLPPLFFPGAKLGLSNVFSLAALIMFSPAEAFLVVAARTLLGAMFAGNLSALLYSFTGGILSMAVSSLLLYLIYPKISVMSVSIAAAITHNITQCLVFVALSGTPLLFGYMPYLALIGIPAGAVVGGVTILIFKGLPKNTLEKFCK